MNARYEHFEIACTIATTNIKDLQNLKRFVTFTRLRNLELYGIMERFVQPSQQIANTVTGIKIKFCPTKTMGYIYISALREMDFCSSCSFACSSSLISYFKTSQPIIKLVVSFKIGL